MNVLVLEAFVGPRPAKLDSCHNDGVRTHNHLSNLRWDTRSANLYDAVEHGTNAQTRKTHCPLRHKLVMPNLRPATSRNGHRGCLACARATSRVYNARVRRGVELDHKEWADRYYATIMADAV